MLREVVLFLAVASVAQASLSIAPLENKPEKFKNVEGCYIKDLGKVLPFGESAPCPHHCMEYRCTNKYVQIATCGAYDANGCTVEEDHSKPYPDCCPKITTCKNKKH